MDDNPYQPPLAEQDSSARHRSFRFVRVMVIGAGIAIAILAAVAFFTSFVVPG
jgi:hypothetical protein